MQIEVASKNITECWAGRCYLKKNFTKYWREKPIT